MKDNKLNLNTHTTEYKTCDKCCYDILDSDGDVMEHYCFDDNLIAGVDFSESINQLNNL